MLTLIRLLQGMSLGGEFSGSITYVVEHAPTHRRGLAGSASMISLLLGFMLGILVVRATMAYLGMEAFEAWGWRLPFIFGIFIGLTGFYIRNHCHESPLYLQAVEDNALSDTPIRDVLRHHRAEMMQGFGTYLTVTMPFYLSTIYFITLLTKHLHVAADTALNMSLMNMVAMLLAIPVCAHLSDKIGRKKVMQCIAILMCVSVYPLFSYFTPGQDVFTLTIIQLIFCLLVGAYLGPVSAMLVELFPTSVRFSGMAITYNLAAALFGGTAPMICEWLIARTDSYTSLAWYVILCNVVSIISLSYFKERYQNAL